MNWIESYLRRRSFHVSVNGSLPQVVEVASDVPQGSVLGHIFFVIYVNDLTDNLRIDHLLYADDVKLDTGFSADDDVARATKKPVECFSPKAILRGPHP